MGEGGAVPKGKCCDRNLLHDIVERKTILPDLSGGQKPWRQRVLKYLGLMPFRALKMTINTLNYTWVPIGAAAIETIAAHGKCVLHDYDLSCHHCLCC